MSRPERLVVVAGTSTDVGKTWLTAALARRLGADGVRVAARKPAQSFDAADANTGATDADVLAAATGEDPHDVCPPHRWYPVAMAPPMAADVLGRPRITVEDLLAELRWPDDVAVGFVETAGGVRSPIAHDADAVALAGRLAPDVVLVVTAPALGAISHVRLAADALRGHRVLVAVNRYDAEDDLHRRNVEWLRDVDGLAVATDLDAVLAEVHGGHAPAGNAAPPQ